MAMVESTTVAPSTRSFFIWNDPFARGAQFDAERRVGLLFFSNHPSVQDPHGIPSIEWKRIGAFSIRPKRDWLRALARRP
jgi:hypothetical protein